MMLAADYPFLDVFWSILVFFVWVAWFLLLFHVIGDVFRRRDIGGGGKTLWLIFVLLVPFLGVFVYLIARGRSMHERDRKQAEEQQAAFRSYVRQTAGSGAGSAEELHKLSVLKDKGDITQEEFDRAKAKLLAA